MEFAGVTDGGWYGGERVYSLGVGGISTGRRRGGPTPGFGNDSSDPVSPLTSTAICYNAALLAISGRNATDSLFANGH